MMKGVSGKASVPAGWVGQQERASGDTQLRCLVERGQDLGFIGAVVVFATGPSVVDQAERCGVIVAHRMIACPRATRVFSH